MPSIGIIIVVAILVIIVIYLISAYNGFVSLRNRYEESYATMDVYLQKRSDLVPNLVETVKGYATHEKTTLEEVVQARNVAVNASDINDKLEAENALTQTLSHLFALSENYPDLKANTNFIDLQNQLSQIEDEIAQSRKYFNAVAKENNIKVESFPSNVVAKMFNFTKKPMFEVVDEKARENVKVQF